jgi:hypothetical protein
VKKVEDVLSVFVLADGNAPAGRLGEEVDEGEVDEGDHDGKGEREAPREAEVVRVARSVLHVQSGRQERKEASVMKKRGDER